MPNRRRLCRADPHRRRSLPRAVLSASQLGQDSAPQGCRAPAKISRISGPRATGSHIAGGTSPPRPCRNGFRRWGPAVLCGSGVPLHGAAGGSAGCPGPDSGRPPGRRDDLAWRAVRREVGSAMSEPDHPGERCEPSARASVQPWLVAGGRPHRARSCATRPSAGCCCWPARRYSRSCGRTRPWSAAYAGLRDVSVGPAALHLDLTLAQWAADGLLAIFFFVAGLELKREFVAGDLRDPRRAAVPVAAAVGGMVLPAALFIAVNLGAGPGTLARLGHPDRHRHRLRPGRARRHRPAPAHGAAHVPADPRRRRRPPRDHDHRASSTPRTCTSLPLSLAALPLAVFAVLVQRRVRSWWLLLPLAVATWALVHASGVHATVAGVLLGVHRPGRAARHGPGTRAGRTLRTPIPAHCRPGSPCRSSPSSPPASRRRRSVDSATAACRPVTIGIIAGLVVGKAVGILRRDVAGGPVHPGPARPTSSAGSTCSASPCSAGSGSPCPC